MFFKYHFDDYHFIRVLVFDNRRDMRRYLERRFFEKFSDSLGAFMNTWHYDINGRISPFIGLIVTFRHPEKCEFINTLSHECLHAAIWYLHQTGMIQRHKHYEERLCNVMGRMIEKLVFKITEENLV